MKWVSPWVIDTIACGISLIEQTSDPSIRPNTLPTELFGLMIELGTLKQNNSVGRALALLASGRGFKSSFSSLGLN